MAINWDNVRSRLGGGQTSASQQTNQPKWDTIRSRLGITQTKKKPLEYIPVNNKIGIGESIKQGIRSVFGGKKKPLFIEAPERAAKSVFEAAKTLPDIPRYAARRVTEAGLTAMSGGKSREFAVPQNKAAQVVFGEEPLKTFPRRIEEAGKTTAAIFGKSEVGLPELAIGALGVGAMTALDTTFGSGSSPAKTLTKNIIKELEEKFGKQTARLLEENIARDIKTNITNVGREALQTKYRGYIDDLYRTFDNPKALPVKGEKPRLTLSFGPPAGGKSTIMEELKDNSIVVDSDVIKEKLIKNFGFKSPADAHKASSGIAEKLFYDAIQQKKNVAFVGSGANVKRYQEILDRVDKIDDFLYHKEGRVAVIPKELSIRRTMQRNLEMGRGVPAQIVSEDYAAVYSSQQQLQPRFNDFKYYDTTGTKPREIFSDGGLPIDTSGRGRDTGRIYQGSGQTGKRGIFQQTKPVSQKTKRYILDHYSQVDDLTETKPEFFGTAQAGAERARMADEGFKNRTYFYEKGTAPEHRFIHRPKYRAVVDKNIYNLSADPNGFRRITDPTQMENEIISAGYDGYRVGNAYAIFNPVRVNRMVEATVGISPFKGQTKGIGTLLTHGERTIGKLLRHPLISIKELKRGSGVYAGSGEPTHLLKIEFGSEEIVSGRIARYLKNFKQDSGIISVRSLETNAAPSRAFKFSNRLSDADVKRITSFAQKHNIGMTVDSAEGFIQIHHIPEYLDKDSFVRGINGFTNDLSEAGYRAEISEASYKHTILSNDWEKYPKGEQYDELIQKGQKAERGIEQQAARPAEGYNVEQKRPLQLEGGRSAGDDTVPVPSKAVTEKPTAGKIVKSATVERKVAPKTLIRETTGQRKPGALRDLGDKLKAEAKGSRFGKRAGREAQAEQDFLASLKEDVLKGMTAESRQIRKQIGYERHTKNFNGAVISRIKEAAGITEWKNATRPQLERVLEEMKKLKPDDSFLTDKQIEGLADYVKTFDKDPRLITKREIMERYREQDEIMSGFVTKHLPNIGFATVDIKEGHPVISQVVDKADFELRMAQKRTRKINEAFDKILHAAERPKGTIFSKSREVGEKIFRKLSGENVALTADEAKAADYLKEYFAKARKDLALEKYRKNYITHTEKTFFEKLATYKFDLKKIINSYRDKKTGELPVDVLLNLDQIVGSEKFFKFALERKGVIDPTTNVRRILRVYSEIAENKKALDAILPEGQAAMQLLVQPKSAVWLKKYLQNLKGRGLDYNFRSGKAAWVAKTADRIIDFGYIRLVAANLGTAVKNIIGGETNSFVFQPLTKYLTGKKRLLLNPVKSWKMISEMGLLDGSYVDIVEQGFVGKVKKAVNLGLYAPMQAAEYEIRGSFMLGELTEAEWKAGTVTPKRFREILDGIAITQGLYTKVDSPLFVQTTLGRSALQFSRWKITNASLVRRISIGAKSEWARKEYLGKNTQSLIKMFLVVGAGMYLAAEAAKAGNEQMKKYAQSATELVNVFFNAPVEVYKALAENPLYSNLDSIVYSYQQLASYLGISEPPRAINFRSGIEDTYFAAFKTLGITEEKTNTKSSAPGLPKLPELPKLPKLPKLE